MNDDSSEDFDRLRRKRIFNSVVAWEIWVVFCSLFRVVARGRGWEASWPGRRPGGGGARNQGWFYSRRFCHYEKDKYVITSIVCNTFTILLLQCCKTSDKQNKSSPVMGKKWIPSPWRQILNLWVYYASTVRRSLGLWLLLKWPLVICFL